ncbi:rab11 family-interacting protein 1-like isoform X2 [Stigmatopora nigra]
MSLVEQSQQSFPTSVQVTVHQARNLRSKGKNGTNDAYAIIQVAKDKFSTSVDEKSSTPVWKEEASFGLPLFHSGNVDRCTLYIIVMHRVQAGLDKFLGQAVINLVDLHQNKSRQKPDWFPLVNKTGKEDKVRGDVLLGITFLRNNMSASMVDLSMQDKPRSRMSKLKDKMRLKKKDSFSDSGSAMSHVLTDSEGDGDSISSNQTRAEKKKSKLKNLFAPKSNLQRNSSQSMSTLGTLPSKNSSLSGSRSSGINVETPEAKKKFKFLGHKRSGSSDSKVSLGALSFLSRSKRSNNDLTNPSVNSAQVNPEDPEDRSSSTISVNSSVHGSMETVPQQTTSDFEHKSRPVVLFRSDTRDRLRREDQRRQEEEEQSRFEAMRLHEEEQRQLEEENRKQSEEYERNGRFLEDEDRREKEREEEEEEQRRLEIMENEAMTQKSEAQKRQEEASMSERLSSLFGMIRKKEERKEEALYPAEEVTTQAQHDHTQDQQDFNARSSFENFSLTSSNQFNSDESPFDEPKSSLSGQTSNLHFLNRTAIVSPVKPRPHPVQPMSTSQQKNLYLPKGTAGMVAGMANSGPFTQLTHEELITLVVRQQADLSKKDGKIGELEEYIDNLLVRVIEEKPAILQSLNAKPT